MVSPLYLLIGLLSWPVVKVPFRLRAQGLEYLPAGGFVLAANHTSNFDPWPLGMPLWPRRQLRFMAKSELFKTPLAPILLAGGAFKVRRGEGDIEAMRKAVELVREGEIVMMFPEGTRRTKGLRKKHEAKAHTEAAELSDDAAEESFGATRNIDESAIEATIRRVAEASLDSTHGAVDEPLAAAAHVDETAIEATIRRVAEAKSQAEASVGRADDIDQPTGAAPRIDGSATKTTTIRGLGEATARDVAPPQESSHSLRAFMRASPDADPSDEPWRKTTDRLQRDIASINAALITLAERLEALTEEMAGATVAASPTSHTSVSSKAESTPVAYDEDEWDESPKILSLPTSLPPRPAVFRDPSPAAATAEPLVEEPVHQYAPTPQPAAPAPAPAPPPPQVPDAKRGFDLLPRTYRITIEDKRRSVDLVPLHRSLLAMDGVRDMSLLSYNNGVAIVALETVSDIDPKILESIVGRAMSRGARVEQHNEYTLVVKLAEE